MRHLYLYTPCEFSDARGDVKVDSNSETAVSSVLQSACG